MLRKSLPLVVCLFALSAGCEKKEPEAGQVPVVRQPPAARAPAGMTTIREAPPLFMTNTPVTVREYVDYLRATGQPVPDRLLEAASSVVRAGEPVTGLSRSEAERYATWAMKRLPTREEWQMAQQVVGPTPYPWTGEEGAVAARLYLVQDWLPGSEGEAAAREAKASIAQTILEAQVAELKQLQEQLAVLAEQQKAHSEAAWKEFKPAFFELVETRKKLSELQARDEARRRVLEILRHVAQTKGRLAAQLALPEEDTSTEEAARHYEEQLAQWRTEAQQARQTLEERARELQQQVIDLTRQFDQVGPTAVDARYQGAQALLEQTAGERESLEEVRRLSRELEAAIQSRQREGAALSDLPTVESIAAENQRVQKQIEEYTPDVEVQGEIEDLKSRIAQLGQNIGRDFLDEELLVQELDALVEAEARKHAVSAALAALRGVMAQVGAPPQVSAQ